MFMLNLLFIFGWILLLLLDQYFIHIDWTLLFIFSFGLLIPIGTVLGLHLCINMSGAIRVEWKKKCIIGGSQGMREKGII